MIAAPSLYTGEYPRARRGDWFLTFTGKQFFPLDPDPSDICIEDIAHALSNICRFGGHSLSFYSVAQHSVLVSRLAPPGLEFVGLMHDATEAYVGDMVRPLKRSMPDYVKAEERVWLAVCDRFGIAPEAVHDIKVYDNVALMIERRDVVIYTPHVWNVKEKPTDVAIVPQTPESAEQSFLDRFEQLRHI